MKLLIISAQDKQVSDVFKISDDEADRFLTLHGFEAIDDGDNVPGVTAVEQNQDGETVVVLEYPVTTVHQLHLE